MFGLTRLALVVMLGSGIAAAANAAGPRAEVIHWWTSSGESAAIRKIADAYRSAGGVWVDTPVAGSEQARAITIGRILGGTPPTAAQFNISRQFHEAVEQGVLNNVDDVAAKDGWDKLLPEAITSVIKVNGHYYAAPVNIHMPAWIWYSKAAFKKAGIAKEPASMEELFADLDKLKASGLIPLAHGGQAWQENIVFMAVLANAGGKDLYLAVMRDRDPRAINSDAFKKVLRTFKRLKSYVDPASPGRNWNDATALVISGKAGVQIMGDWAKAEFTAARRVVGSDYGCIAGFGAKPLYLVQGDAFVFPKTANQDAMKAQKMLAHILVSKEVQVEFNKLKGSMPVRTDIDTSQFDVCTRLGVEAMKDKSRQVGIGEVYFTPDRNGALTDVLTAYWNTDMPVEKAQKGIAAALVN